MTQGDWFVVAVSLVVLLFVVVREWDRRADVQRRMRTRDAALFQDAHTEARRRHLASLQHVAKKGFDAHAADRRAGLR